MIQDKSFANRIFDGFNHSLLLLIAIVTIFPFLYVVVTSFSNTADVIPKSFSLDAYKYIFSTRTISRSLGISIYVTVLGSFINLLLTSLMAYALANKRLPGRSGLLLMVVFTMLFSGGMIPTYFVVKWAGLMNSLWALMIPNAISAFNLIILKSFFQNIPEELKESARMDGCHELRILYRIVLPLSLPAMAAIGLFSAVALWNQYFSAILYISESTKWPVQVLLRQVVILAQGGIGDSIDGGDLVTFSHGIKMAVIVVSMVPILIVYPFLQKHFAKGVLLGSVKG
jgi:putative aldouronate transport system permease protein